MPPGKNVSIFRAELEEALVLCCSEICASGIISLARWMAPDQLLSASRALLSPSTLSTRDLVCGSARVVKREVDGNDSRLTECGENSLIPGRREAKMNGGCPLQAIACLL